MNAARVEITLYVNGEARTCEVEPRDLLVQTLRETFGLTGTHVGCDTSSCGACTVHLGGRAVKSCTMYSVQADGEAVTTIEGIGTPDNLHPLQAAFRAKHALQCGFCTSGMIMCGIDVIEHTSELTDEAVRHGLEGNICRCTGYANIVAAVLSAAETMRA